MPEESEARRFRVPPSFGYWAGLAIALGCGASYGAIFYSHDPRLGNAVATCVVMILTKIFERKLENELRLKDMKQYWRDNKSLVIVGSSNTVDKICSMPRLQGALKAHAYMADTNTFINRYMSVNTWATFSSAIILAGVSLNGIEPTNDVPVNNLFLLPLIVPLSIMWGPAFHLVQRNNDLMDS